MKNKNEKGAIAARWLAFSEWWDPLDELAVCREGGFERGESHSLDWRLCLASQAMLMGVVPCFLVGERRRKRAAD